LGSVSGISAKTFVNVCPSALVEVEFTEAVKAIWNQTPKLAGFCDSQYFCEAALFGMVKEGVDICRTSQLFGISHRVVSLVSSLVQAPGLSRLFHRILDSAIAFTKEVGMCAPDTFWFTIFEDDGRHIHHESGYMKLKLFGESIKKRAECVAGGREVVVIEQGHELDRATRKEGKFRVLVRSIDPYLTAEENQNHRSVFERSFGAVRFSCDTENRSGGAHRTIITLPHGLPYINSRVLIPTDGIETVELTPIVVGCFGLERQITQLNNALNVGEIRILQPLIQGTLIPGVNPGWTVLADQFLQGSVEDENTGELRGLLGRLLETLERAVEFHGNNPEVAQQPFLESGFRVGKLSGSAGI
jgi:hypothetical protein